MKTRRKSSVRSKTKKCGRSNQTGVAVLNMGRVKGIVQFIKQKGGVKIKFDIKGLRDGMHGFHIHEYGDMTEGCKSACSHFNPKKNHHGGIHSHEAHLGDLGNVIAKKGVAKGEKFKRGLSLDMCNKACIIGRMIIIHKERDDLGRGGDEESLKTGNAGPRLACGVIGLSRKIA